VFPLLVLLSMVALAGHFTSPAVAQTPLPPKGGITLTVSPTAGQSGAPFTFTWGVAGPSDNQFTLYIWKPDGSLLLQDTYYGPYGDWLYNPDSTYSKTFNLSRPADTPCNATYTAQIVDYTGRATNIPSFQIACSSPPPDTESPTISWADPRINDGVYWVGDEHFLLRANANDNVGVTHVHFFRDADPPTIYNDTIAPYEYWIHTTELNYGWNKIYAEAHDQAGNVSARVAISVYRYPPSAYIINGRVLDQDDNPLPDVHITNDETGEVLAVSGADGRFQISGLPNGHYILRATRPGYTINPRWHVDIPGTSDEYLFEATLTDTASPLLEWVSPTTNGEYYLIPQGSTEVYLSVNASDPGSGIARVEFLYFDDATASLQPLCTSTAAPYECTLDLNQIPVEPSLTVAARAYDVVGHTTYKDIVLSSGLSINGVVIGPNDLPGDITVPIAGIRMGIEGHPEYTDTTEERGIYVFGKLPPGTHRVVPLEEGYEFRPLWQEITLTTSNVWAEPFIAARPMQITVRVSDEAGNVQGAHLVKKCSHPYCNDDVWLGTTDSEGFATINVNEGDHIYAQITYTDETDKQNHDGWYRKSYRVSDVWVVEESDDRITVPLPLAHTTYAFNLVVSIQWDATPQYIAQVRRGLLEASQFLSDATNGQVVIGWVMVHDEATYWDDADVRIRAVSTYRVTEGAEYTDPDFQQNYTNLFSLNPKGKPGIHLARTGNNIPQIYLSRYFRIYGRDWFGIDKEEVCDPGDNPVDTGRMLHAGPLYMPSGYRTFVHEFGHYSMGLLDLYDHDLYEVPGNGRIVGIMNNPCTTNEFSEVSWTGMYEGEEYLDGIERTLPGVTQDGHGVQEIMGIIPTSTGIGPSTEKSGGETLYITIERNSLLNQQQTMWVWLLQSSGPDPVNSPMPQPNPVLQSIALFSSDEDEDVLVALVGVHANDSILVTDAAGNSYVQSIAAIKSHDNTFDLSSTNPGIGDVVLTSQTEDLAQGHAAAQAASGSALRVMLPVREELSEVPQVSVDLHSGAVQPVPVAFERDVTMPIATVPVGAYVGTLPLSDTARITGTLRVTVTGTNGSPYYLARKFGTHLAEPDSATTIATTGGEFRLTVPAGALDTPAQITLAPVHAVAASSEHIRASTAFLISAPDTVTHFDQPATATIWPTLAETVDVSTLKLHRWNMENLQWEAVDSKLVPGNSFEEGNLVEAQVDQPGIYSLLASPASEPEHIYLPFISASAGSSASSITINEGANRTNDGEVQIHIVPGDQSLDTYQISNNGVHYTSYLPLPADGQIAWELMPRDSDQCQDMSVYVRLRDAQHTENVSPVLEDTIEYCRAP
jgi:hypothetical protein